jgi:hypothetical protein
MDTIKRVVPIWKREHWADGREAWVHPGLDSAPSPSNSEVHAGPQVPEIVDVSSNSIAVNESNSRC